MTLGEEIKAILGPAEKWEYCVSGTSLYITYGQMYESPELNFAKLVKLSQLFGTDAIDVDDYSYGGCESCDWGSDYGHTIRIDGATKNVDEFKELKNEDRHTNKR